MRKHARFSTLKQEGQKNERQTQKNGRKNEKQLNVKLYLLIQLIVL